MYIISELILQLSRIKSILEEEIKSGQLNYSFKVCENECKFLSIHELREYITITEIKNNLPLKETLNLCNDIDEILNPDTLSLPQKKTNKHENDFHALYLEKNNIVEYRSLEEKRHFINSFKYSEFNMYDLIIFCGNISELLIKSYPNLISEEIQNSKKKNPYPRIFKNPFSFKLFERLFSDYKNSNNLLADFSFIYRMMKKHGYILVKPEEFKEWLSKEPFSIVLEHGLKTLPNCSTDDKKTNYNTSVELIKQSIS
jgi:hypothetical protein